MKAYDPSESQNIPVSLPREMRFALETAEEAETWVNRDKKFLEKQRKFHDMLLKNQSSMRIGEFEEHFSVVAAYSTFRETLGLLKALGSRHPDYQMQIVTKAATRRTDSECWGAMKWRIRYAVCFDILTRVFSEERLRVIKRALERQGGEFS
jgi:phosphate-selective porin